MDHTSVLESGGRAGEGSGVEPEVAFADDEADAGVVNDPGLGQVNFFARLQKSVTRSEKCQRGSIVDSAYEPH